MQGGEEGPPTAKGGVRVSGAVAVACMAITISLLGLLVVPEAVSAFVQHASIRIVGNENFTAANGVTGGTGTATDPYLIQGWEVRASLSPGIQVWNTSAAFAIKNVAVYSMQEYDCIDLTNVSNARIEDSVFGNCYTGISLTRATNVSLEALRIDGSFEGISAGHVTGLVISNTTVSDNSVAMAIYSARDVTLRTDIISSNVGGGISIGPSDGVRVISTQLQGDSIVFSQATNFSVVGSHIGRAQGVGIWVYSSSGGVLFGNTVDSIGDIGRAVDLMYSAHVDVIANTITNVRQGIRLYGSGNSTIAFNDLTAGWLGETDYGVYAYNSVGPTIVNNTIALNDQGVQLDSTTGGQVFHNDFLSNGQQAVDNGGSANTWDNGYPSGGNYWSNYTGVDHCSGPLQDNCTHGDGIGDAPYIIDDNSRDRYPLMAPASTAALPPQVGIFSPLEAESFASSQLAVEGWASEVGGSGLARVLVRVDDGPWSPARGTASWSALVNLTLGFHVIQAQAWDSEGNPSSMASVGVYGIQPRTPRFTMVSVGTLGGATSRATDINDQGQVVGQSRTASGEGHAFLWSKDQGIRDLGTLGGNNSGAAAVNDLGQVVGSSDLTAQLGALVHPFLWTDGHMVDLGTLGGHEAEAADVNDDGVVVGYSSLSFPNGPEHAFIWENGTMTDLGSLSGGNSRAEFVNDLGQVLGDFQAASGGTHAFLWSKASGMVDLGTLGGDISFATDLNGAGQVVGESQTPLGSFHAFLWQSGTMKDLGTLGGDETWGGAINELGQVAGSTSIPGGLGRAFLYSNGSMTSLGTLGGDSSWAADINDRGWVVGEATTAGGEGLPFVLTAARGMQNLDAPVGRFATTEGINNIGQVVGLSTNASNLYDYQAVVWEPEAPTAALKVSPSQGSVTTDFTLDASASYDSSDSSALLRVRWDWDGDGTWDTGWSTDKVVHHFYSLPGNYSATVEVMNSKALTDNATATVTVVVAPLSIAISAVPAGGVSPLLVSFTASVTGGLAPYTFAWSFGDGATSTETNPVHTFQAGSYTVTLTVMDSSGQKASTTSIIAVRQNAPLYTSPLVLGPAVAAAAIGIAAGAMALRRRKR